MAAIFFTTFQSCNKDEVIDPAALHACFADVPSVIAGTPIQFNSDCSQNETSHQWDFGGQGSSTVANPSFTFSTAGTFVVKLTVYRNSESHTTEKTITIQPAPNTCTVTHSNRDLKASETWKTGETHCINGFFQIMAGVTLTIEPGVTIKLKKNAGIYVVDTGAGIIAEGTADKPILFTSSETVPQVGDWVGIHFTTNGIGASRMKYCTFEYGGSQAFTSEKVGMMEVTYGKTVSVDNCTFRKSKHYAVLIDSYAEFASFTNNTISEAGDYAIFAGTQNLHSIGAGNTINNKGIWIEGAWFNGDATWLKQTCPYYTDGFNVGNAAGMTLTISPGVEIKFINTWSSLDVGGSGTKGKLIAQGNASQKIKLTSDNTTPAPGDWNGFHFYPGTMGLSIVDHVIVEYAGGDDTNYAAMHVTTNSVSMTNSEIRNVQGMGIHLDTETFRRFSAFSDNTITVPNTAYAMKMTSGALNGLGEGNVLTGKAIYFLAASLPNIPQVIWRNMGVPYIVDGKLYFGSATIADYTVIIEPGTTLKFKPNSWFVVGNSDPVLFKAIGTATKPITFTSASDTPTPGSWDGLEFYSRIKAGTTLEYCTIEYGGNRYANVSINNTATAGLLTISNCKITNSSRYGFYSWMSPGAVTLTNNTFANNAMGDTKIE
ncbi:MAG TPA: PKD domain-containing protein [Chryseosolibacter sp.]